jgi:GxxExxY protein
MPTILPGLLHRDLTEKIIGVYYDVRRELGTGFLEKVCHRAMVIALRQAGLQVEEQVRLPVYFRGILIGDFSADIVVNGLVLVEVKCFTVLEPRHKAQVMNYLCACDLEVGLLFNFGAAAQFDRIAFTNERKTRRS